MGYYIDLVFEEKKVSDQESAVERLSQAGAKVDKRYDDDPHYADFKHIHMDHPDVFGTMVVLNDGRSHERYGEGFRKWAYIRVSWAFAGPGMEKIFSEILSFAEQAGARTYADGVEGLVTQTNLAEVLQAYEKGCEFVAKMI